MGGALAQYTATKEANVGAAVSFYGGFKKVASDWANLNAPIMLIYAENDQGVPIERAARCAKQLEEMGKNVRAARLPERRPRLLQQHRPELQRRGRGQTRGSGRSNSSARTLT